jgi:hypothetical protein
MQYETENPLTEVTLEYFFFPENLGEVSDDYGEKLYQDIMVIEMQYQGMCTSSMLADYC